MRVRDEQMMLNLGSKLASVCVPPCIIYFQGQLGAGKTTFTRGFLHGLGFKGRVKSPSYSLLETYSLQEVEILHLDLYRIKDPEELEMLGVRELFHENTIALVEWPDMASDRLPLADIVCEIDIHQDERTVDIKPRSASGEKIMINFTSCSIGGTVT